MTRRLVLAILGTAIAALLLAGLGTFLLTAATARRATERAVLAQSIEIANNFAKVEPSLANRPGVADTVQRIFRIDGLAFLRDDTSGKLVGTPPKGVSPLLLNPAALLAGKRLSGHAGKLVWAAAPAKTADGSIVVAVLVRKVANSFLPAWRWFLLASGAVVLLGALVAVSLSRRLTRPIRQADQAARRIAAGELSTRLVEPLHHETDELAQLVRSVNSMASSLERSKGVEQQFLLSISHDLRTPLTSIRGYAEAISDGATTDPAWAAGVILKESRRLERLVADLLELAKLQSRSFSFQMQPVDLAAVALDTLEAFGAEAADVGLQLIVDAPEHITVEADRDRLGQVAANLVENAKNFAKSTIAVGARVIDGTPMLWVDDDGPGIAPGDRPHVFERLYRTSQQPVRAENSSGLGLAIVAELTAAMRASITAEQAPGGGARMVVRFAPVSHPR
jgi:signal transduction histidine kinase